MSIVGTVGFVAASGNRWSPQQLQQIVLLVLIVLGVDEKVAVDLVVFALVADVD